MWSLLSRLSGLMRSPASSAVLLLIAPALRSERLPVETFAQPAAFSRMALSADGKYVAYTAEYENAERVFFRNVDNPKEVMAIELPSPGASLFGKVFGIQWVSSKRLLINTYGGYVAVDRDGKEYAMLTGAVRIYAVNRQDTQRIWSGPVIHVFNQKDSDYVLMSEYNEPSAPTSTGWISVQHPNIIKMDTRRGLFTQELKNPGDIIGWAADRDGQIRIGVQIKNRRRYILYRDSDRDSWRTLETLGDQAAQGELMGFSADNRQLYVSRLAENGRQALYEFDPKADRLGELIAAHDHYDISPANGARLLQTRTGRLLGVSYVAEARRFLWMDPDFAALQKMLDAALPKASNEIAGLTTDEKFMLVLSSSARNPGTYYLFDREKNQLGKFVDACPWIDPAKMADVFPLRLAARDGLMLNGYLTVPPGREMKNLPLIVMPHGGPWLRDTYGFDPLAQFLANRGYAVLKINYRGSVGHGQAFYEKGFRQVGTGMQEDIEDAVRWTIAQGIANAQRIGILGGSFGGYSTLMGLIRTPDLYRCGINIAGVTDWSRIIRHSAEMNVDSYAFNVERIGDPQKDAALLREISPVNLVEKIQAPLLIVHGRDDPTVPYEHARILIDALDKAHKPHEDMIKYNEPHGIYNYKNRIELFNRIEKFLQKHLPADA